MKKRNLLVMLFALVLIFTSCGNKADGDAVATVDGVAIPQSTFDLYYRIQRNQVTSYAGEDALDQTADKLGRTYGEVLRTNLLDSLISRQVVLNAASNEDLGDIDALVNEEFDKYIEAVGKEDFEKDRKSVV